MRPGGDCFVAALRLLTMTDYVTENEEAALWLGGFLCVSCVLRCDLLVRERHCCQSNR